MVTYVPIEDIPTYTSNPAALQDLVDRYHVSLSQNVVSFNKANQEKTILLANRGWEKVTFAGIITVGSNFVVTQNIPEIVLPGSLHTVTIRFIPAGSGTKEGGIYFDVGNTYGNKFVKLTGVVTP